MNQIIVDKSFYYLILAGITGAAALILIPKEKYKKYFIYGLLFGGVGDTIMVTIMSKWLHLFNYKSMGVLNILNLYSLWTPITWTFVFAVFFYLLPVRKVFLVPYLLAFIGFSTIMGTAMSNLGLFEYTKPFYQYIDLVGFILWEVIAAWVFIKNERIELK